MKKLLLFIVMMLPMVASANALEIYGIYYNLNSGVKTAEVTTNPNNYIGDIVIPSTIVYNKEEYKVTSIGTSAFNNCTGMTSIIIPNGVTKIEDDAFWDCTGLASINIPNTVEFIGNWAFRGCSNLTSVKISDGVTTIGSGAFEYCSSLTSITLPYSVTVINAYTFCGCTSLTSVNIPNSVTLIGKAAFSECKNITSITIPGSVTTIKDEAFSGCSGLTSVTIPNSLTILSYSIFRDCTSLASITIPNSVTSMYSAFSGCSSLTSVTIPNSVTSIDGAFSGCSSLTSVTIPNSVTSIGESTFRGCSGLTSVTIPNSVTSICSSAFEGCTSLTSILIPNEVIDIGNSAFANCINLTSINIPNSVTSIGNGVFSGCSNLATATLGNSVTSIGNYLFQGCSSLSSIVIPSSVTSIANYVFDGCKNLNSIVVDKGNTTFDSRENCNAIVNTNTNELLYGCNNTVISNGVISVRDNAFNCFDGLKILIIPESVTNISDYAFSGLTGLTSISVAKANPKYDSRDNCNAIIETATNKLILACSSTTIPSTVTSFKFDVFKNCITLTLPEGLENIPSDMFYNCDKLVYISIPSSVKTISETTFNNCSRLKTVIFEDGTETLNFDVNYPTYYAKPQWFFSCPLDSIYMGRNVKFDFTPQGYGTYNLSPFREKQTLRKVVFGDNVTVIPASMFNGCNNLISVLIPEKMDSIGDSAFNGCESLTSFTLPHGIRTIGSSTFDNCKNLTSIIIPETVKTIEEKAFYYCEGLAKITIPKNVINIGRLAFGMCTCLSDIEFLDGETSLKIREESFFSAFSQCPITKIYLGRNIINDSYNYIYSSLASITTPFDLTISKYVTELKGGTFANCDKIKTLTFEEGTDTIKLVNDHNAYSQMMPFANTPIDSIYMGRVVVGYDYYYPTRNITPFAGVGSSFSMRIGNNIEKIGDVAYSGWNIDSLYIPKNVKKIESSPFNNCAYLHDIFIEDGDETLVFGEGIGFYGIQLRNLYLGRNVNYPENKSPFSRNKEALTNLTIGNHVTDIGDGQFTGCKSLVQLNFPESLKRIGRQAFYGCTGLTTLDIPSNIVEVKKDAFNLCTGLSSVMIEDSEEALTIDNNFMNGELKKVYLGRNINYPEGFAPFSGLDYLDSLIIGSKVTAIDKSAFAACPKLKDVVSYTEIVPTTNEYAFTNSYLPNATLRVPYSLYDQYCTTIPWSLFGNIKNFEGMYNLVYLVDGEEYKKHVIEYGSSIIVEAEPTKEGYTFSEWSEIPETMPEHDITVIGTFSVNKYKLTYMIDDEEYAYYDITYGTSITPELFPVKEGYTFSGWKELPETMPAHDVTVTGNFIINTYQLTYLIDGVEYVVYDYNYGIDITPEPVPVKEGYTFSGWSAIPTTMPARNVTVTGSFNINNYKLTYMIDGMVYKEVTYEYSANITPEPAPEGDYESFNWIDLPKTMPAYDVVVNASYTTGISELMMSGKMDIRIYSLNGKLLNRPQKGINIIKYKDGTTKKVVIK